MDTKKTSAVALAAAAVALACTTGFAQKPGGAKAPLDLSLRAVVLQTFHGAIAYSPLPERGWKALADAVGKELAVGLTPDQAEREYAVAPSASVTFKKLGGGGREAIVDGPWADCSGDGNCPMLIFRRTGSRWTLLLDGGYGTGFYIQPTSSHGLRDVVASSHDSAFESVDVLYRFNGSRYARAACWDAHYAPTGGPPQLTRCR
ncbi:MAG: hypothetical protein ACRD13_06035 [Terriglobales bacterium]